MQKKPAPVSPRVRSNRLPSLELSSVILRKTMQSESFNHWIIKCLGTSDII